MLVANNVQKLRWPAKKSGFISYRLLDLLKRKVRAQLLKLYLRELTRVIHQICAAIPHQYIHMYTFYQ